MNVLALSGSLRAASLNSALLRACARLAPAGLRVQVYAGVGALPLFNPDLEAAPPAPVRALRAAVADADALLVASPEYAHGVSGALKNALDWLVSFEPFHGKPVAVPNTSPRAQHAHAALCETLRTMSATLIHEACIALPLLGTGLDGQGMVDSAEVSASIRALLAAIGRHPAARSTVVHTGGCHCGRVRFEVWAPAHLEVLDCNCSICRRTGYLHLIVARADFRLLAGEDALSRYQFNTGTAQHLFCATCGIKSFYVPRSHPDGYSVNARCLEPGSVASMTATPFDGREWEEAAGNLGHNAPR